MKKILLGALSIISLSSILNAKEGLMCSFYYESILRKVKIIDQKKENLSQIAINKLYTDLKFETVQCLGECENVKFDYCNEIAKKIENQ